MYNVHFAAGDKKYSEFFHIAQTEMYRSSNKYKYRIPSNLTDGKISAD